jgi:hypothetical protein
MATTSTLPEKAPADRPALSEPLAEDQLRHVWGGAEVAIGGIQIIRFPNGQWGVYDEDEGVCRPLS